MKRIFRKIASELSESREVMAIVLYGSFARGDANTRSDIDLLILTKNIESHDKLEEKIIVLESLSGHKIQPTIRTVKELSDTDTGLLQNIFLEDEFVGRTFYRYPNEMSVVVLDPAFDYTAFNQGDNQRSLILDVLLEIFQFLKSLVRRSTKLGHIGGMQFGVILLQFFHFFAGRADQFSHRTLTEKRNSS